MKVFLDKAAFECSNRNTHTFIYELQYTLTSSQFQISIQFEVKECIFNEERLELAEILPRMNFAESAFSTLIHKPFLHFFMVQLFRVFLGNANLRSGFHIIVEVEMTILLACPDLFCVHTFSTGSRQKARYHFKRIYFLVLQFFVPSSPTV